MAGITLERSEDNQAGIDALLALVEAHGGERVGLTGLAGELTRRLRRTYAPSPRLLGRKVTGAWTWERDDRRDPTWWPQGITTSVRTGLREQVGRDLLLTSWYSKGPEGARVSLVDVEGRRYEHLLLVEPVVDDGGRVEVRPVKVHAGGLVWHGPHVHVAATARGLLTCRTADVLRIPAGTGLETFGHRYVLPVHVAHRGRAATKAELLRFSFLTLDRSGPEPALVVGEYGSPKASRRIARFAVDDATGLPLLDDLDGTAGAPTGVDDRGEARMQGIAVVDGVSYVTRSRGRKRRGSVYVGTPGAFREHARATPVGPEDLVHWPETDALWSVSEHPRRRWVFAMRRAGLPG